MAERERECVCVVNSVTGTSSGRPLRMEREKGCDDLIGKLCILLFAFV